MHGTHHAPRPDTGLRVVRAPRRVQGSTTTPGTDPGRRRPGQGRGGSGRRRPPPARPRGLRTPPSGPSRGSGGGRPPPAGPRSPPDHPPRRRPPTPSRGRLTGALLPCGDVCRRAPPCAAVRLTAWLRPLSTDSVTFFRPHPGDREVVPNCVHRHPPENPSPQLSGLWNRGRRISTGCGRSSDPQAVHEVVHGQPTGSGQLSPMIGGFSTWLSTVRQRGAPGHRVE